MTYTNAVLNESMRLYPPAWITDRQNLEDDSLAQFKIKKDTLIGVSFTNYIEILNIGVTLMSLFQKDFLVNRRKNPCSIFIRLALVQGCVLEQVLPFMKCA